MKRSAAITFLICYFVPLLFAATPEFGEMAAICQVSFPARTQMGEIPCHVAVCRLDSDLGSGSSLYVVTAYDREYSPRVERILEMAHSPIIEKTNDRITVLFTSGANTTSVMEFSVATGLLQFVSTEAIAWNDRGRYRTTPSFSRYSSLLEKRDRQNQAPSPTPASVTTAAVASIAPSLGAVVGASPSEAPRLLRFPGLLLPRGQRIAAIRIDVFGVRVSAFPKIPVDWRVSLDLEGSWRSRVCGECQHGVGGLGAARDLDGIVAAESEDWSSVRIEGVVYVTRDFDHLEEIKIDGKVAGFSPNKSSETTRGK